MQLLSGQLLAVPVPLLVVPLLARNYGLTWCPPWRRGGNQLLLLVPAGLPTPACSATEVLG